MKAFVTSIGEPTTDLCVWALERNGFDVEIVKGKSKLAEKLKYIYETADDDFLRVDADVIVNNKCLPTLQSINWWTQFQTFDWYKQALTYGGVQLIKKECLPILRDRIDDFMQTERPETAIYRINEFMYPRRCTSLNMVVGIHGYGIEDIENVIATKTRRNQLDDYDFELAERLNEL